MTDREKVLKGLKYCAAMSGDECRKCPYEHECYDTNMPPYGMSHLAADAFVLLKEQEPVLLKNQHKSGGHFTNTNSPWKSTCPRCGKKIEGRQTRFCKYCGLAVRWG